MDDTSLFEFESDFVNSLRCIPMAVRFKLDACGIKLSLRQWSRLTLQDRQNLRLRPCESPTEVAAYHEALVRLVAERTRDVAKPLPEPADIGWKDPTKVPEAICAFARSLGVEPPELSAWASLTPLQRFTLVKLSRDNHDNVNFLPALREFGIQAAAPASARAVRTSW